MLEPLLKDLKTLEDDEIFVPSLGKVVKGTVFAVVAHSVGGFVECFSALRFCRFCVGDHAEVQPHEVAEGVFPLRTKTPYVMYVKAAV